MKPDTAPLASCRFQIVLALEICGRPTVLLEIRRLIRKMSIAKALWERQTWALQQVRQLSLGYPCFEINAESSNAIACG